VTPFRKQQTASSDLNLVQEAVDNSIRSMQSRELLNGTLITGVTLDNVAFKQVPHNLGRKPNGYLIVGRSANAVVWDDAAGNAALADKSLKLRASAAVTVALWVF
jgi:hypothetical protein